MVPLLDSPGPLVWLHFLGEESRHTQRLSVRVPWFPSLWSLHVAPLAFLLEKGDLEAVVCIPRARNSNYRSKDELRKARRLALAAF